MPKQSGADRQVLKGVNEAETALRGLEKDLRKAVKRYHKHELDPIKAKAAFKKVDAFLNRQASTLRLARDDSLELSEDAKRGLTWLDGVVADLLKLQMDLKAAYKMSKKDPDLIEQKLVKRVRELSTEIGQPPRGVGVLVKQVKKGLGPGDFAGVEFALLPMIILFWMIADTIYRNLAKKD